MRKRPILQACALLGLAITVPTPAARSQELPKSGVAGYDFVYATSPGGSSRLFTVNTFRSLGPIPIGPAVSGVPSRWAHRRRTLGALETAIASPERGVFLTPMGSAVGNGAIHFVDARVGVLTSLTPTGNPAAYDLLAVPPLKYVFSAEDAGTGDTILRGYSYATPGVLTPLTPASILLGGRPAAHVNRIGFDAATNQLHVPTDLGIHVLDIAAAPPQMAASTFHSTAPGIVTTNPTSYTHGGQTVWVVGTSMFDASNPPKPVEAGLFTYTAASIVHSTTFGVVPSAPAKRWVPAVGTEELAVVSDGTDAYVYYLLREPPPGTFFIKPSAVGVVRTIGNAAPVAGTILLPDTVGEPFSIPTVSGSRVAFEASFGEPFTSSPPGGGEVVSVIYTPLDPLGASSVNGVLGVPAPLGGRISTKGMDRPIWTRDGTRVMAATSHFAGAPNPTVPGLEVLDVPADHVIDQYTSSHTVLANNPFPNQSIVMPSAFDPRLPGGGAIFAGLSFFGNVFNQGVASLVAPASGEIGQMQIDPTGFVQSTAIPDFPAILPPSFHDANGSLVPVPGNFGARRTTFNVAPAFGFDGLVMTAAMEDEVLVQRTGTNVRAALGLAIPVDTIHVPLPAGWITTSEFHSF